MPCGVYDWNGSAMRFSLSPVYSMETNDYNIINIIGVLGY